MAKLATSSEACDTDDDLFASGSNSSADDSASDMFQSMEQAELTLEEQLCVLQRELADVEQQLYEGSCSLHKWPVRPPRSRGPWLSRQARQHRCAPLPVRYSSALLLLGGPRPRHPTPSDQAEGSVAKRWPAPAAARRGPRLTEALLAHFGDAQDLPPALLQNSSLGSRVTEELPGPRATSSRPPLPRRKEAPAGVKGPVVEQPLAAPICVEQFAEAITAGRAPGSLQGLSDSHDFELSSMLEPDVTMGDSASRVTDESPSSSKPPYLGMGDVPECLSSLEGMGPMVEQPIIVPVTNSHAAGSMAGHAPSEERESELSSVLPQDVTLSEGHSVFRVTEELPGTSSASDPPQDGRGPVVEQALAAHTTTGRASVSSLVDALLEDSESGLSSLLAQDVTLSEDHSLLHVTEEPTDSPPPLSKKGVAEDVPGPEPARPQLVVEQPLPANITASRAPREQPLSEDPSSELSSVLAPDVTLSEGHSVFAVEGGEQAPDAAEPQSPSLPLPLIGTSADEERGNMQYASGLSFLGATGLMVEDSANAFSQEALAEEEAQESSVEWQDVALGGCDVELASSETDESSSEDSRESLLAKRQPS